MKAFIVFDAYVDSYQIANRIGDMKNIKGVKCVEALERVAGEAPRYCLEFDIDDSGAKETGARIKEMLSQYSSYMSNVAWGGYISLPESP